MFYIIWKRDRDRRVHERPHQKTQATRMMILIKNPIGFEIINENLKKKYF